AKEQRVTKEQSVTKQQSVSEHEYKLPQQGGQAAYGQGRAGRRPRSVRIRSTCSRRVTRLWVRRDPQLAVTGTTGGGRDPPTAAEAPAFLQGVGSPSLGFRPFPDTPRASRSEAEARPRALLSSRGSRRRRQVGVGDLRR